MKKIIMLLLFFSSYLTASDTLTAVLLITECDICEAKSTFGYIVKENGIVINYLDKDKKAYTDKTTIWGAQEKEFISRYKKM